MPTPDCFKFKLHINIDNKDKDGQLVVGETQLNGACMTFMPELGMEPVRLECPNKRAVTSTYSQVGKKGYKLDLFHVSVYCVPQPWRHSHQFLLPAAVLEVSHLSIVSVMNAPNPGLS